MPKAVQSPSTSRRRLLSGVTAAALLATPAVSAPDPDGALIAAIQTARRLDEAAIALDSDFGPADPEMYRLVEQWTAAVFGIAETRACTPLGLRAKAELLNGLLDQRLDGTGPYTTTPCAALTWSLLQDVLQ